MICYLAARYSPDELELYLLDFKEGVSFAQFAPGRRDPTWLPHARLIGVNINTDREFGLALLQHLSDEMRRRAEVAKANEVTKLEELRRLDENARWPRIVAVIDEFQVPVRREGRGHQPGGAAAGRPRPPRPRQGIHLVLASQDVSSIEAFWMRPAIFEQFVLRIGLPRARRVLTESNDATMHLPRWHAVVNHESGMRARQRDRSASRTPPGRAPWTRCSAGCFELRVGGARQNRGCSTAAARPRPRRAARGACSAPATEPLAVVGQCIDVAGSAATVAAARGPRPQHRRHRHGRHDAVRVLGAAAACRWASSTTSAEARLRARPARGRRRRPRPQSSHRRLAGHDVATVRLDGSRADAEQLAEVVGAGWPERRPLPVYLVLYAGDAADTALEKPRQTEALRKVLRFGPEVGVHTIGWWRSPARLRVAALDVRVAGRPRLRSSPSTSRAPSSARSRRRAAARRGPRGPAGR